MSRIEAHRSRSPAPGQPDRGPGRSPSPVPVGPSRRGHRPPGLADPRRMRPAARGAGADLGPIRAFGGDLDLLGIATWRDRSRASWCPSPSTNSSRRDAASGSSRHRGPAPGPGPRPIGRRSGLPGSSLADVPFAGDRLPLDQSEPPIEVTSAPVRRIHQRASPRPLQDPGVCHRQLHDSSRMALPPMVDQDLQHVSTKESHATISLGDAGRRCVSQESTFRLRDEDPERFARQAARAG